jgi:hypothetical protein
LCCGPRPKGAPSFAECPAGQTRIPQEESDQILAFEVAIAPYVAQARSAYPSAKARFGAGLPLGQDSFEQVFVAIREINDGITQDILARDINLVHGHKKGDPYAFPETELLDWVIVLGRDGFRLTLLASSAGHKRMGRCLALQAIRRSRK